MAMNSRTQPTPQRGWLSLVLALIAALEAILVGLTASASAAAGAETRVRTSAISVESFAGPLEHVPAGQRLGRAAPGPQIVVATGVAAKGAEGSVDELLGPLSRSGRTAGVLDLDGELIPLVCGKSSLGSYAARC